MVGLIENNPALNHRNPDRWFPMFVRRPAPSLPALAKDRMALIKPSAVMGAVERGERSPVATPLEHLILLDIFRAKKLHLDTPVLFSIQNVPTRFGNRQPNWHAHFLDRDPMCFGVSIQSRRTILNDCLRDEVHDQTTLPGIPPGWEVDHVGVEFKDLMDGWLEQEGLTVEEVGVVANQNATKSLINRDLAARWQAYHRQHATLEPKPRDEHRARHFAT